MLLFLANIASIIGIPAHAQSYKALPLSCNFTSESDMSTAKIFSNNSVLNCESIDIEHHFSWAYYDGLDFKNNPIDPLEFRMSIHEKDKQEVFVRYSDGHIATSPTSMDDARLYYSWGELSYKLPDNERTITGIIIKTEHSHSDTGGAPNGKILTKSEADSDDIFALSTYTFMMGVICILLPLSTILFFVTKQSFLLAYSASLITVLISGIFWSGAISYFIPSMDVGTQKEISALAISLYGICQIFLMITTFEENRHKKTEKILLAAGVIAVLGQFSRIVASDFQWQIVNDIVLLALAILVIGLYCCALISARRGSMVARLYTFVWAIPFIVATIRIAWGLELFIGYDKYILVSPLFMLFGEGVLGALVVGYQVHRLRNERDTAKHREASLITLSETDELSGLLNRRAFLTKALEGGHRKSLILVDIDHFKAINDTYGHAVGDDTIEYITSTIKRISPKQAIVGRLGGEEFGVLIHSKNAAKLAQTLCDTISTHVKHPPVTISCGIADGFVADEQDWRKLYVEADKALYTAKNNGRNQIYSNFAVIAA